MTDADKNPDKRPSKGIYLLPNLLTTTALFAGFYGVMAANQGRWSAACAAIFIAMIFDALDGRVARLTNTQSDFGKEYDSLADMLSFGIAPALIIYEWSLHFWSQHSSTSPQFGWLVAFVYVACAALRLARFNSMSATADKKYFQGLASPAAAAVVVGLIWAAETMGLSGADMLIPAVLVTAWAGVMMVTNFAYRSFKEFNLSERVPFTVMLILVGVFVLISIEPPIVLFSVFLIYALSGPFESLRNVIIARREKSDEQD